MSNSLVNTAVPDPGITVRELFWFGEITDIFVTKRAKVPA